jgi:hypothetical protein
LIQDLDFASTASATIILCCFGVKTAFNNYAFDGIQRVEVIHIERIVLFAQ